MIEKFKRTINSVSLSRSLLDIKWFEEKQAWIDQLDGQLQKVHGSVESLIHHRKELTAATGQLAKGTAILGNCEEQNSLSCVFSRLAATQEKIEKVYERQTAADFALLCELLKDYIALIGSAFQALSAYELALSRKREQKGRLQMAMKTERVPPVEEEIRQWEAKVEKAREDCQTVSGNIKTEFERFEGNRIQDFKRNFLAYMESLLQTQEALVQSWEGFLPEAKSIVV
ncbi:sorting nexin-2 [Tyrophagus putrescentiae]|nr:sorting nexin-2 [Tyrophagus putrescentiae]